MTEEAAKYTAPNIQGIPARMRAAVDFQGFLAVALPTIDISLSTGRSDEWCEGVCHATRLYREALEAQGLHIAPGEPPRNQRSDLIIGEPGAPADVRLGMRLIGDDELATVTITQHNKTITLNFTDSAHAARIADALQGYQPYAVVVDREEPTEPTSSAEPESEELLPCPFCGGREAFVEHADYEALQAECEKLRRELQEVRDACGLLGYLFSRNILAQQSAIIEAEHGGGPAVGMEWIWNTLFGPGQIPDEDETDAQAYFDRELAILDASRQEAQP